MTDSFMSRLDADTTDWLHRFILDPYSTDPEGHPALKFCGTADSEVSSNASAGSDRSFKVYIRTYKTTALEERERLEAFVKAFPHLMPQVSPKLQALEGREGSSVVWGHYIGQTIFSSPVGRHKHDQEAALNDNSQKTTFLRWLAFTSSSLNSSSTTFSSTLDWKIYEFRAFHTPIAGSAMSRPSDVWRSRPDLQALEYGMTLAADKRGWNSAPGGLPQTAYVVLPLLQEVLSRPEVSQVLSSDLSMSRTFSPPSALIRKHFKDNYQMAPARLNRTVSLQWYGSVEQVLKQILDANQVNQTSDFG